MAKKQNESKAKKVFESKYNPAKLRELIKAGKSCVEIQKELSIVSKQSMRQHVLRLINEDRTFYEIDGLYERSTNILKAGKYGLKLSPKKLQSLGIFLKELNSRLKLMVTTSSLLGLRVNQMNPLSRVLMKLIRLRNQLNWIRTSCSLKKATPCARGVAFKHDS